MPVTTRSVIFLVGDPYKSSFATVIGWGVDPNYIGAKASYLILEIKNTIFTQMVMIKNYLNKFHNLSKHKLQLDIFQTTCRFIVCILQEPFCMYLFDWSFLPLVSLRMAIFCSSVNADSARLRRPGHPATPRTPRATSNGRRAFWCWWLGGGFSDLGTSAWENLKKT